MDCTNENCGHNQPEPLPSDASLMDRYLHTGVSIIDVSKEIESLFKRRTELTRELSTLLGDVMQSEGYLQQTEWEYSHVDRNQFIFRALNGSDLATFLSAPYGDVRPTRIEYDILRTEDNDLVICSLTINGNDVFMEIDLDHYARVIEYYHLSSIDASSILAHRDALYAHAKTLNLLIESIDREYLV